MNRSTITIMDIAVDHVTQREAVQRMLDLIAASKIDRRPRYVATVNVDFFVNAYHWWSREPRSQQLIEALHQADLVTADGMPLVWLSRWIGSPLPERVPGSTLVPLLAAACASHGYSIFLLGGEPAVAQGAVASLREAYPSLNVVGVATPDISLSTHEAIDEVILQKLADARPDVLLIGLGNPKQELWFQRVRDRLQVPLSMGVGGTFKFLAGTVSRAPEWMQRWGLEWLYRLMQEPRTLGSRYLRDLVGFPILCLSWLISKRR